MPPRSHSPRKISPSEIHFTLADKTTKIIVNKRTFARKTITRKAKAPRPTLAPQWNITTGTKITNYTPHTITVDTQLRQNTLIRKNDIAIATETKPRLIHMVACKTVGDYKRNQEKIRKFCLEEARNNAARKQQSNQGPSSQSTWTHDKVKKIAQSNQQQQQQTSKRKAAATTLPPRTPRTTKRRFSATKSPSQASFNTLAQQAALNYPTETSKAKRTTPKKVVHLFDNLVENTKTVVNNMERDFGATSPIKIAASSTANIFSDLNATSQQEPQHITSDDEQQSECPISIIPAPAKKASEVTEQVQSDPSSNTVEVEELVQTDPKICDNQNTSPVAVGSHPKVIFLESPNGGNKSQHQITNPQDDPSTNNTAQSVTNYEQDYSPAN